MKLVCLSDTHTQHHMVKVPDGDILVFAGDFAGPRDYHWSVKYTKDFAGWFNALPHEHKVIIAGNHDTAVEKTPDIIYKYFDSSIHYLHDSGVTLEGLKFWGSPYSPEYLEWAFNLPRDGQALEDKWNLIPDDTDILITHGPPHGFLDQNESHSFCGCPKLLDAVLRVRPKFHIFGHIHENAGMKAYFENITFVNTSIVNVHNQPYSKPIVLDIED